MTKINATNLRLLRVRRNLTLDALEELSGVNRVTISRIENGSRQNSRRHTLEGLAKALSTDIETLTGPDLNEGSPDGPFSGRKSQMNVRMADDARNALALVALRYNVKPAHILHVAPFLFLWAAEESLRRRQKHLDEVANQWDLLGKLAGARHLSPKLQESWEADDLMVAEEGSIRARDLFGLKIADEHLREEYEDSEQNPFARFLASLAADLGDLAEFEHWSPYWDGPGYTLGQNEAERLTGGNAAAAGEIVHGYAPLHELPREIREAGPKAIAEWATEAGNKTRETWKGLLDELEI
ncbi:hypothetical protein GCM10010923_03710 [Blastomonas marina]|uniref:HTH cro/C1-type domain-containing protein n=1 Tax=Blastomonas marina TaxID=1867408 RepID=A0ABQ1F3D2_9SPHN|nr:helix-turn-helix transcriptional regulator [Blastomonas marina]GFZ98746.1 hypothetical protein GCM10010923_03710 [Blastomonas marina]